MIHPQAKIIRGKKLGVLIRDARQAAGKSRKDTAAAIGISSSTLGAYERGAKSPSLPELELLTYFLDIPLEHFWGNEALSEKPPRTSQIDVDALVMARQETISSQLKDARDEAELTLKDLSEEVDIPSSRLSDYENGKKPVPLPELEAMTAALGLSLDNLQDHESQVGDWISEKEAVEKFLDMPNDLQAFVCKPINRPFLELAQRLSEMPVEKLREVAESLLEITL
jgi:transcriptional regulator with XRE-family HTH domain